MNSLEEKLREILDNYEETYFCNRHANKSWDEQVDKDAVNQIIQAFKDDGWFSPKQMEPIKDHAYFMAGAIDDLARHPLRALRPNRVHRRERKRASGISSKEDHEHMWCITSTIRYRDPEKNEFIQDNYKCECGAGRFNRTPKAMFHNGRRSTELSSEEEA